MWVTRTAGEGHRQGKYARGTRLRSLATIIQVKAIIRGLLRLRIARIFPLPAALTCGAHCLYWYRLAWCMGPLIIACLVRGGDRGQGAVA